MTSQSCFIKNWVTTKSKTESPGTWSRGGIKLGEPPEDSCTLESSLEETRYRFERWGSGKRVWSRKIGINQERHVLFC